MKRIKQNKNPKISVVIPSFNKVKYIKETLDSIAVQTYKNYEVIIQDGGSNDGTLEIIKSFVKKNKDKFSYVSKKDGGQLNAINKGFKKATGEIVTYINADDIYEKNAFNHVVKAYLKNPDSLWFVGKGRVINEKGKEIAKMATLYKNILFNINNFNLLLMTNYFMQPSVFLNKKSVKNYGLFAGTKFSVMEYEMWLRLGKINMPSLIDAYLSKFRLEKDTKTATNAKKLLREDEKIVKKYTKNLFIFIMHILHNFMRVILFKTS